MHLKSKSGSESIHLASESRWIRIPLLLMQIRIQLQLKANRPLYEANHQRPHCLLNRCISQIIWDWLYLAPRRTGELGQTNTLTDGRTGGCYQMHYLPAMRCPAVDKNVDVDTHIAVRHRQERTPKQPQFQIQCGGGGGQILLSGRPLMFWMGTEEVKKKIQRPFPRKKFI